MSYEAKIILDSVGPNGARLTTFELSYPRFVHADLMTHRVFSRNAASSRAVPAEKRLTAIEQDPVLPIWWGKNQSGMQAREELQGDLRVEAERLWRRAVTDGVHNARALAAVGLHKQLCNRIAEPGMFITVVVTATEFDNFFALRDHPDAQPELADVAAKAHELYKAGGAQRLPAGAWHLPYVTGYDSHAIGPEDLPEKYTNVCMVSVGRCAAVSYLNQDKRDLPADIARAEKNLAAGHMSPFEHVAQALTDADWRIECNLAYVRWMDDRIPPGNLWGWRQLRKTLPNEHDFSKIEKHV